MVQNSKHIFLIAFFLGIFVGHALSDAQAAAGDYDDNGRSDVSVVSVSKSARTTTWFTKRTGVSLPQLFTFTVPGDALIQGRYYAGDDKTYPGVVWVRDAVLPLEWYVKNAQGSDVLLKFGLPGDGVPNQGDVDCDGITDFIVTRNGRSDYYPGLKLWYIALSDSGLVQETPFGLTTDRAYVADLTGDNCAELLVLRAGFTWFGKSLSGSEVSQVQWGLPGDFPILPFDLNGDRKPDYIISRATGSGQRAYVRYSSSSSDTFALGGDGVLPMAGKFKSNKGLAYWDRSSGLLGVRQNDGTIQASPFGIAGNAIVRPDGTVIQPTEDGKFGSNDSGGGGGNCSTPRFPDGSGGFLWKPVKEGGTHTRGGPTILGSNSIRRVVLLGNNGSVVNEPRLRYYNGSGGRSVWDPTKVASELAPDAPITVRVFFPNGSCEDRAVPDPRRRYD